MTTSDAVFTISRTFAAPQDLVWECWSEPHRMAAWLGPKGAQAQMLRHELVPGGIVHFSMAMEGMTKHWGKLVYREIDAPHRLVWEHSFADAEGNLVRHFMSPTWPLKLLTTVTLARDGQGTKVTLEWRPLDASAEDNTTFQDGMEGMNMGWGGSFDQLADYLETFADDDQDDDED
jgi:uncharacterized protein YndB with AHSA1/START domain